MSDPMSGISGTDGQVPVYDPNGRWTIWDLGQIYTGGAAQGRYVPKVRDHVVDPLTNEQWRVTALNPTTMVPTLVSLVNAVVNVFSQQDVLLGVGPGTQSDTYRVYIDKSVVPHTLAVDARLRTYGSMARTAKIFRGSEITGDSEVISAFFDGSGDVLTNEITLELVATSVQGQVEIATRSVPVTYTTKDLPDNEIVTIVFYSDTGNKVSKRQLLVENTRFIRSTDSSVRHIIATSLESPFLSSSDPNALQCPMNVTLGGLSLVGVVHYSDGSVAKFPVDGTKFELLGFPGYVSTIIGQKFDIVLKYNVANGEINYIAGQGEALHISETYTIQTTAAEGRYTPKLYGYPVWQDAVNGYRLKWYLYTLERDVVYDVTNLVTINTNTPAFSPLAYGVTQSLSVSVNLNAVNGAFSSYIHTQTISFVLAEQGTARTTNWTVAFDPNQTPVFGQNNFAASMFTNVNSSTVSIGLGASTQAAWLERLYGRVKPLVDPAREVAPPAPTHFALVLSTGDAEFPISQWNQVLTLGTSIANNGTLFVKFFKRTSENDIQLAIAGLPVYQQN